MVLCGGRHYIQQYQLLWYRNPFLQVQSLQSDFQGNYIQLLICKKFRLVFFLQDWYSFSFYFDLHK